MSNYHNARRLGNEQVDNLISRIEYLEDIVKQKNSTLEALSHICTCNRPAISIAGGGVKAPGPHTHECVSVRARVAFNLD